MHFVKSELLGWRDDRYGPLWTDVLGVDALAGNPEGGLAWVFDACAEFGAVERRDPKLFALLLALHQRTGAVLRGQTMTVGSFGGISEPNPFFPQRRRPLGPRAAPNIIRTVRSTALQFEHLVIAATNHGDSAAQVDERLLGFDGPPAIGAGKGDDRSVGRNGRQYIVFAGVRIGSRGGWGIDEHFWGAELERAIGHVFDRHFDHRSQHGIVAEQAHVIGVAVVRGENDEIACGRPIRHQGCLTIDGGNLLYHVVEIVGNRRVRIGVCQEQPDGSRRILRNGIGRCKQHRGSRIRFERVERGIRAS